MNREIKFRAWYGGKMLHNVAVIGGIAMREENPKGDCVVRGEDGTVGYTDWATYQPLQGAILMQFTGLKDKNGVEIYEGDIVDTGDKDFGFKTLPVVFRECCFTYPHSTQPLSTHAELVAKDGEGITVIGNIHDNAELLEQK